jgi:predicted nucleic acid-binding Zn ribbon protein
MASKKSKFSKENGSDVQRNRRARILQIVFAALCLMVVLSMVLAAVSK